MHRCPPHKRRRHENIACIAVGCPLCAADGSGGWYFSHHDQPETSPTELAEGALATVKVPDSFTDQEQLGKRAYDAVCAACHGANGQGQDGVAPPLVHVIYEPSHHGDRAFLLAAQNGVRGHHWPFGNMPPVEGITQADVMDIVAYIRRLQRENGID